MKKLIGISITMVWLYGCYYDNAEEIHPSLENCDTTNITYTNSIAAIMQRSCGSGDLSCHKTGSTTGIFLDNYQDVLDESNDKMMIAIRQTDPSNVKPMPYPTGRLNNCTINKIQAWINNNQPQ